MEGARPELQPVKCFHGASTGNEGSLDLGTLAVLSLAPACAWGQVDRVSG